jgi:hypothetical protein
MERVLGSKFDDGEGEVGVWCLRGLEVCGGLWRFLWRGIKGDGGMG